MDLENLLATTSLTDVGPAEDPAITARRPVKPVFVLSNGIRVGIKLAYSEQTVRPNAHGTQTRFYVFRPVVEGDVAKMMPMVYAIDADSWPADAAIVLPLLDTQQLTKAWSDRVLANSECLKTIAAGGSWSKK